jgi:hypothetical protein
MSRDHQRICGRATQLGYGDRRHSHGGDDKGDEEGFQGSHHRRLSAQFRPGQVTPR